MRRMVKLAVSAMVFGWALGPSQGSAQADFRHEIHGVFFPECGACHTVAGGGRMSFPDKAVCTACHDGTSAPAVSWTAPMGRTSGLRFTHTPHGFGCETCHLPGGSENLSALSLPVPETCLGCHAPGTDHRQADDCGFCHRAVTQLDPVKPSGASAFHEEGFATSHGSAASLRQPDCSGCHAESTCLSCHEGQSSPGFHPLNFLASHGPEAYGRVSDCSGCHSPEAFCRDCHSGLGFQAGGALLSTPFHNDQPVWVLSHSQAARQDLESCVSCHQQTDCLSCHSASAGWGVSPHGPGFAGDALQERNKGLCTLCHISGG